jgi:hypothetical protein
MPEQLTELKFSGRGGWKGEELAKVWYLLDKGAGDQGKSRRVPAPA